MLNETLEFQEVKAEENSATVFNPNAIIKLNITDQVIAELKRKYLPLKINGVEDTEGFKKVYAARQDVKRTRIDASSYAKELRENAVLWQRRVISEEKRVVGELESIENHLQAEESRYEAEKEKIKQEKLRLEQEALQVRVSELAALGYNVDLLLLKSLTAEQYTVTLSAAKSEWARREAEKAEAEKQRLAAEEKARQDAEELRVLRENQARADKIIRDQQEAIDREKAELVRKEQARLDQIKKDEQARKDQEIKNRTNQLVGLGMHFHLQSGSFRFELGNIAQIVQVTQESIENAIPANWENILLNATEDIANIKKYAEETRLAEIEKQKADAVSKALAEQVENDRLKKNAEAEKLALASDKEKWAEVIKQLNTISVPEMKSAKARKMAKEVEELIAKIKGHIQTIL